MRQVGPSLTANSVAMMRAAHQLFDDPIIFKDPIALNIIGTQAVSNIHSKKRAFKTKLHSYLRAIVIARSCFAEAELSEAIKSGVNQYVILGAGLDTFAYRNPNNTDRLHVFEVDYPASLNWKRQQLNKTGIRIPNSLTFVPIDFETQSLADQLKSTGFKTDKATFFSWLGVTMYLTHDAMMETMKFIASSTPPGSKVVFDYVIPPFSQNFLRRLIFYLLSKKVERGGEQWKSFYEPASLIKSLKAIGFSRTENIGPDRINALFFKNRADNLLVGNLGHLMKAEV
jgi:methyltransferase (TIGR00027 family)